jgi:hypothetical protein
LTSPLYSPVGTPVGGPQQDPMSFGVPQEGATHIVEHENNVGNTPNENTALDTGSAGIVDSTGAGENSRGQRSAASGCLEGLESDSHNAGFTTPFATSQNVGFPAGIGMSPGMNPGISPGISPIPHVKSPALLGPALSSYGLTHLSPSSPQCGPQGISTPQFRPHGTPQFGPQQGGPHGNSSLGGHNGHRNSLNRSVNRLNSLGGRDGGRDGHHHDHRSNSLGEQFTLDRRASNGSQSSANKGFYGPWGGPGGSRDPRGERGGQRVSQRGSQPRMGARSGSNSNTNHNAQGRRGSTQSTSSRVWQGKGGSVKGAKPAVMSRSLSDRGNVHTSSSLNFKKAKANDSKLEIVILCTAHS